MKIGQQMLKESKGLTDWLSLQKKLHDGLPCELQNILSADITEAYRNKCEFTIGNDLDSLDFYISLLNMYIEFVV